MKVLTWKKKATNLLKTRFLVTLNLKERWKVVELKKYLKTRVELKIFERKLKFEIYSKIESSKIIGKLTIRKLNLRIGILGIKFEINWKFENYLRMGVLKMKLWIRVLEIRFERNWSFKN